MEKLKIVNGKNKKFNEMLKSKKVLKKNLAEMLSVTVQTISKISNGGGTGVETALKIAKILDCDVKDLFELEEEKALD